MNTPTDSLRVPRFSLIGSFVAALGLLAFPLCTHAALLTSWTQYSGSISSGLNTASPVLGNGTADSADGQTIYAVSPVSYTLGAVGDSLTLSGAVVFQGLATPQADQFRFGLYDVNSQSGATGWLGYFASNSGASAGQTYTRLWERNNPNTGSFGSGTGATLIASANASPSNTSFVSGSYNIALTVTRSLSGLDLAWSITGTDVTYSVSGTFTDTTPQSYTFNRVGFFTGGGLNAAQTAFSDISLAYTAAAIPEPATTALLLAIAAGLLTIARRRATLRAA